MYLPALFGWMLAALSRQQVVWLFDSWYRCMRSLRSDVVATLTTALVGDVVPMLFEVQV